MLGSLLRIGAQLGLERGVELGRRAARSRPGERPDRHFVAAFAVLAPDQDLGRGADDLEIAHVVEVHVRRRIERANRAVEAERRAGVALGHSLADLHLHQVARGDVLLGARDGGEEVDLVEIAPHRLGGDALDRRRRHARSQPVAEHDEAPARGRERFRHGGIGVDDEVKPAREVVDDRDLLALDEQHVGRADRVGQRPRFGRRRQARLDVAHGVVAEVAGEAAAEARQPGPKRDAKALLVGGDEVERVAFVGLDDAAVGDDLAEKAARAQSVRAGRPMNE